MIISDPDPDPDPTHQLILDPDLDPGRYKFRILTDPDPQHWFYYCLLDLDLVPYIIC